MLLPIAGVLYQLRDYLKIVGRGHIKHHLTYNSLLELINKKEEIRRNKGGLIKNSDNAPLTKGGRGDFSIIDSTSRPPSPEEADLAGMTVNEPFVSIHIPSYNEEPDMLIKSIQYVTQLDYTNYELIIIENNTTDEKVWKPVEKFVAHLGKPNIRFYHFDELEGYKSGALNKALELTDLRAEIIALLDADYCVSPDWLKMTVGLFEDPKISAVQCPQANRIADASTFQKIMSYELDLFYKQGMVIRNESNAVIMNGTMCLIRRSTLDTQKWCTGFICEDSELGLRIQSAGGNIVYIDHTFGVGLPPRNFEEYKKQRFRWAYGAMMIFKTHWRKIFFSSQLTFMQRFEYLFGWIGWGQMILYPFYLLILLF